MKDITTFSVKCGPGEVRYCFNDDGAELQVFVGEYVKDAPPDANSVQVVEGCTTFIVKTLSVELHPS